jgi:hypothetical protein
VVTRALQPRFRRPPDGGATNGSITATLGPGATAAPTT